MGDVGEVEEVMFPPPIIQTKKAREKARVRAKARMELAGGEMPHPKVQRLHYHSRGAMTGRW